MIFSSIRQRLLVTLILAIASISVLTLLLSYQDAQHEVQELFDAQLAQSARTLQALTANQLQSIDLSNAQSTLLEITQYPEDGLEISEVGHTYEIKIAFQIWEKPEKLLLNSASAPKMALSSSSLSGKTNGYTDEFIANEQWRVFSMPDPSGRYIYQAGERNDVRNELISEISQNLIRSSLITIPILGLLIWLAVGTGLSPLKRITKEVTQRDNKHLQPMAAEHVPNEIQPLITSLNDLFKRLQQAFEKERRFTGDAAHELRTPLAALKTQAQVALRSNSSAERQQALQHIVSGVDRAGHLINQMLTLARIDPEEQADKLENIQLYQLVASIIADIAPYSLEKKINIELTGSEKICLNGNHASISILLRNLVDNAVRYTPIDGQVKVNIEQHQYIEVSVTDSGQGISEQLIERVFDRFYRVPGHDAPGCGLGLAISKRIADRYQYQLSLQNVTPNGGLKARVTFAN